MSPQIKDNLQTRKVNALSELGEKIFLDRYALKDVKRETFAPGDLAVFWLTPKTGQREIGTIDSVDNDRREAKVVLRRRYG